MIEDSELIARQRRGFEDLNNEIAGRDVGRQARFLNDHAGSAETKRKERDARAFQNHLMELLKDPIYRAKYDGVIQALSDAEQATQAAIDALADHLQAAQTDLADMMDNSARLPDGTQVFRDANGVVRREDGTVIEDQLADTILWTGQEPSFEDVNAARDRIEGLQGQLDATNGYQNDVLGPARDKITDPDNPPSLGELDDIANDIQGEMPKSVRDQMPEADTTALEVQTQNIGLPKLGG
ncbi:hypothetical protein ACOTTU_19280 [Roseobacter sp. EG26]|uniref:hypothetical protein n=1 Tax=Roseobacter sp. EG26 TaxID=3412477 RepID=UPI003CE58372